MKLLAQLPTRLLVYQNTISSKNGTRLFKRLRNTEHVQRQMLRLENLCSVVDHLSKATSEHCWSTSSVEFIGRSTDVMNLDFHGSRITTRNACSYKLTRVTIYSNENQHQRSSSMPLPNQRYSPDIF